MHVKHLVIAFVVCVSACKKDKVAATPVDRELQMSSERRQQVKAKPWVKRYKTGHGPAARLTGVDDDPWPAGIMFSEVGPYLGELGFDEGKMIAAIDGKDVHDVFVERWRTMRIKRPAGFHRDHYRDLIRYLFVERDQESTTLNVLIDVPRSASKVSGYQPQVETWRIKM